MDASALESAIKALEIRLDSLDSWLKFWITLVVIGVVVEVVVVIKEYLHALSEHRRGTIRSPSKPTLWDLGLGLSGGILVAIGVAGELGIDFKSAVIEGKLRDANRGLVALLHAETAKAEERTAELQLLLGPRMFTKDQEAKIIERLSKFKGVTADLFGFEGDEWTRFENMQFARLLASVLDKAGLDTRGYWGLNCDMVQPLVGIDVTALPGATPREQSATKEIKESLSGAGIELTYFPKFEPPYFPRSMPNCLGFHGSFPTPQKPTRGHWVNIKIIIGNKPPAMLGRPTVYDLIRPPPK